ncbi:MAG: hypothetical protein HY901_01580, partial [Deltaproteobacteria bacterium]|nr:hypothetical protein [Deltaproteobacteria bacterium]
HSARGARLNVGGQAVGSLLTGLERAAELAERPGVESGLAALEGLAAKTLMAMRG